MGFHNTALIGASGQGAYNLESSLRFRSSASAYLSWTTASAGNRRTWTWSGWVKRGSLTGNQALFTAETSTAGSGTYSLIRFVAGQLVYFDYTNGTTNHQSVCTGEFRDPSAWYHIVVAVDTTQATASNRVKIYVNGIQQSTTSSATFTQNYQGQVNNALLHYIGTAQIGTSNQYFDGYMTEFNFVDGQALTPSDFGSYDTITGVWKPKRYTGTYGTNGFYLPMKETQQATGFNTVLYKGSGATNHQISNVGFSPDLVWIKDRTSTNPPYIHDSVRGASFRLNTSDTAGDLGGLLSSFDSNGFTISSSGVGVNGSSNNYVAWCWDAGSSTVSNTDGTITANVRANPASGFSIISWTGTGSAGTIGHGLSSAPDMFIVKQRTDAEEWCVYHKDLTNATYYLYLNSTAAQAVDVNFWNSTAPTSSVINLGSNNRTNGSGDSMIAYAFSEVAGFSKFGSYTGTSATGHKITTGFRPAFIMLKNVTTAGYYWMMKDNTRDPSNPNNLELYANVTDAEYNTTNYHVDFDSDGFTINSALQAINSSSGTYIYMAFADTRDAQFNFDASGNKNNWTANNINSNASSETTYDIMNDVATLTDEDTGNFCTWNATAVGIDATLSNGNLDCAYGSSTGTRYGTPATIGMSSGKWYWEIKVTASSLSGTTAMIAITNKSNPIEIGQYAGVNSYGWAYYGNGGTKVTNDAGVAYGASYTTGDVIGVSFDADVGNLVFYKNGVSQGTAFTGLTNGPYFPAIGDGSFTHTFTVSANFGQRPFAYTPPTGYKKLNTYNLPKSNIRNGSQYFNTVLYTGNGTSQSITGLGFSPDLVWIKSRSNTSGHNVFDTIRTAGYYLLTNQTDAEANDDRFTSFDSDGFTVDATTTTTTNGAGRTFVAWNWKGSDSSAVSNTNGTITSTVSANTNSGFSVVTYTGTGANATVGHGLGVVPKMVIVKRRNGGGTENWMVYHASITTPNANPAYNRVLLNLTNASNTDAAIWNNTQPTSIIFNIGTSSEVNASGGTYVAYCFAEVEGFSKFGSYTGNGSTDGPFIYTGFRPAFVMIKRTDAAYNWIMLDGKRDPYNDVDQILNANTSDAEFSGSGSIYEVDFLSNGFKQKGTTVTMNASGGTYIYMAFAENPFKHSLAR